MFGNRKRIAELEQQFDRLSSYVDSFRYLIDVVPIPTTIVANKYVVWADKSYAKVWRKDLQNICYYYNCRNDKCEAQIIMDDDVSFVIKITAYPNYYLRIIPSDENDKVETEVKPEICYYRIIKSTGDRQVLSPELIKELHEILNKEEDK